MAAQVIHAAGESAAGVEPGKTYAVALCVPDKHGLQQMDDWLTAAGVPHRSVREPDPPWSGALMALGIPPCDRRSVSRFLRGLPLLK